MSYNLFLDDVRNPEGDTMNYMFPRIGNQASMYRNEAWVIVKNYKEFTETITRLGLPEIVSFDHDLADIHYDPSTWTESFKYQEETGEDCAKWLVEYCNGKRDNMPVCYIHSMNPVGSENIRRVFRSIK